jgi:hypothetical protein
MYDRDRVLDCARRAGIPLSFFEPWDAYELAIYRPGHRDGEPPNDFALDTGNQQHGLSDAQATAFKTHLEAERVPYEESSRAEAFAARTGLR